VVKYSNIIEIAFCSHVVLSGIRARGPEGRKCIGNQGARHLLGKVTQSSHAQLSRHDKFPQSPRLSTLCSTQNTHPTMMDQTLTSQVKSERDIPPTSSVSDLELLDIDTPPERYCPPGNPSTQSTPRDVAHASHSATPTISPDSRRTSVIQSPSKQPSGTRSRQRQHATTQKNQSPGLFSRLFRGTTRPESIESEVEQLLESQGNEINRLKSRLREEADDIKSMSESHRKEQEYQQQHFRDKWQRREEELQQHYQQIRSQNNETIRSLHKQAQDLASHQNKTQEKYNALIRKQQEESFKQIETGRWLPMEESRVLADFERIRTQMRIWAKSAAAKNTAAIQDMEEEQNASLMASLSQVAVVENNQLPGGLSTRKGLSLLLNALLAHDVYTSFFRNPFFFLNNDLEYGSMGDEPDSSLNKIYGLALACK
jgi:hypothetical protein